LKSLNLFYEEPEPDRWLPFDRYPRRLIRRILRGKPRPGGQTRVFLNLCAGLDKLGVKYHVNDYKHIQHHPEELACIIGKPHVLDKIPWKNPILFGAAVFSHPIDAPDLLKRLPIRKVLVPGEWMRQMCELFWGNKVIAWPVGIDTETWKPRGEMLKTETLKSEIHKSKIEIRKAESRNDSDWETTDHKTTDFLIYDKVRWEHERYERELIQPIRDELKKRGLSFLEIRYGFYEEQDFHSLLQHCKAMIFLCEHETQGIAYQQALACGEPILTWDRGGYWQDPEYYPHRVKFQPVSSVPYWDERCGTKFQHISEFSVRLDQFGHKVQAGIFKPRDYILENLTLEKCAKAYLQLCEDCHK
jgi:glycosyltransferase involved in cell wall biosynthesis